MSLCPAKLFGDTGRSEATGEGYVGDKGHKHSQNQALLVLLFIEQLDTQRAITLASKIEEDRL